MNWESSDLSFDIFGIKVSKFLSDRVFIAGMLKQWLVKSFNFTPLAAVAGKVEHKRGYYLGMKTNFSSKACNMDPIPIYREYS